MDRPYELSGLCTVEMRPAKRDGSDCHPLKVDGTPEQLGGIESFDQISPALETESSMWDLDILSR